MKDKKTVIKFFTIADYREEEIWLRKQSKQGWKFIKIVGPCFYKFERIKPEDVIYRLDYKNGKEDAEYNQMFLDFGWESCGKYMGWIYYRKPAATIKNEEEGEIFSNSDSKYDMVKHINNTRLLPLITIFLCCVLPQWTNAMNSTLHSFSKIFFTIIFILDLTFFSYCGLKLIKIGKELKDNIK